MLFCFKGSTASAERGGSAFAKGVAVAFITGLSLAYDAGTDIATVDFTINWLESDGPVGTPWDMLIEFIGRDRGEPLTGGDDLLHRFGMMTSVRRRTDRRVLRFRVDLDEDDPIFFPWPVDPLGVDEVFVDVSLLPVPRSGGTRARSNTIVGVF